MSPYFNVLQISVLTKLYVLWLKFIAMVTKRIATQSKLAIFKI